MLRIPTESAQPRRFTAEEFDRMGEAGIFADGERVQLLDGFRLQHWLAEHEILRIELFDPLELKVSDILGPRS